jgi:hypothetical protein
MPTDKIAQKECNPMRLQHRVEQIIDDPYAGTLDASAWDRALIGIADWIGSSGAFLFSVNSTTGVVLRDEIHRLDFEAVQTYRKHWIADDIRLGAALKVPIAEPMFERKLDLKEECERSAIFNDFLVPHDTPYLLATWLHKKPDKVVALSFQGLLLQADFEGPTLISGKASKPHLL